MPEIFLLFFCHFIELEIGGQSTSALSPLIANNVVQRCI